MAVRWLRAGAVKDPRVLYPHKGDAVVIKESHGSIGSENTLGVYREDMREVEVDRSGRVVRVVSEGEIHGFVYSHKELRDKHDSSEKK